jgi:hypothetical protein
LFEQVLVDELEDILVDLVMGNPTQIAYERLMNDLLHSINLLGSHLKEMEGQAPPSECLQVYCYDEGEYKGPQKAAIPTARHYQMQQFYYWCLERHANWAKEGAFTKRTCHYRYQLGTLSDLSTTASKYWPQGNHGLILEKVRYDEDLQAYPWGLPAFKLTIALKGAGRQEIYFDVNVRKYLQNVEQWYFEQSQDTKESLVDGP